ncbi:MAG: metallophosphoesterase [Pirellulales bacterium]|nr:metallophosphoesterase [Pirellulales bacterium]
MMRSNRTVFAPAVALAGALAILRADAAWAHKGPDPVTHWNFSQATVKGDAVEARLGPNGELQGDPQLIVDEHGSALRLDGVDDCVLVAAPASAASEHLPSDYLTVAVWASVDSGQRRGWFVSTLERDGDAERGWGLGYQDGRFCFALASEDSDDGNGKLTFVRSNAPLTPDKFCHVTGVYDGGEIRLYVDGKLVGSSRAQSGRIYPSRCAAYVLGACADRDEREYHKGLLRDVAVYDLAATDKWVAREFERASEIAEVVPPAASDNLAWIVEPYLQFVTENRITVMWETSRPAKGLVRFGETAPLALAAEGAEGKVIHEIALEGLRRETPYYYQVEATDDQGTTIRSPLLSFQTANGPETPFSFGVLSDMQYNPRVCKALADQLWMQRPNFVIIPGDLTDAGPNKSHWTEHFFPGMQPLASRVAFFPVLGNHEQDARHYYDYMSLPAPEYCYTFSYGNAQFFMLDSNREVGPGSEQYQWLEAQLRDCRAMWKFVSYHHPSYSSDEDDYGDLWSGKKSSYGDLRMRPLCALYDRYGVDVVWNGHIHSYERTWPLHEEKAVDRGGTIYMITGGAGGQLETAGPIKPWFQNNVKHGHHYCLVGVNGRMLEFKAYDFEGRLFDAMTIDRRETPRPSAPAAVATRP